MPRHYPSPLERFESMLDKTNGNCWLWTGALYAGVGRMFIGGKIQKAHRWSYEHFIGPIPDGRGVKQTCSHRRCVNPAHLIARGPSGQLRSIEARVAERYVIDRNGCWLWTGTLTAGGYGYLSSYHKNYLIHRWNYERCFGPIPAGLELDHLCRVRRCVNPFHLEAVTRRENTLRSPIALPAINATKTHCIRGHLFDEANTHIGSKGERFCRACGRIRKARSKQKQMNQRGCDSCTEERHSDEDERRAADAEYERITRG